MVYWDFPSLVKRVSEVKEFKIQAIVFSLGIFSSLFTAALFDGKLWLIITGITIITLGILVLISKRSLVSISERSMKEVDGTNALSWGIFYLFFGIVLSLFYFLI